jgi:hypothetical protein
MLRDNDIYPSAKWGFKRLLRICNGFALFQIIFYEEAYSKIDWKMSKAPRFELSWNVLIDNLFFVIRLVQIQL